MVHNEDSRVKIPALCHLTRLGYTYLSLKGLTFDEETNIVFAFTKVDESELIIADEPKNKLQRTRETLGGNFDPGDPAFVTLYEELQRLVIQQLINVHNLPINAENARAINALLLKEYLAEFHGTHRVEPN
jgi:hypothetical protein